VGVEHGGSRGDHPEASPAAEAAPDFGQTGDGAAVNQRVAGGHDGVGATAEAVGQTAVSSEVEVTPVGGDQPSTIDSATPSDEAGFGEPAVDVDGSAAGRFDRSATAVGPNAVGSEVDLERSNADDPNVPATAPSLAEPSSSGGDADSVADAPAAFPSDQAEARAQYWHPQGNQFRNYEGTCGLASSAEMMSDQSDRRLTEADVARHAAENGLCTTEADTLNPQELGGTTPESLAVLHSDFGFESHVEAGSDQADLASAVDRGDGVIAAVNCADYWPDEAFESPGSREAHRDSEQHNHAVWVTGVSRSPEGEITGFYVNDTGISDGAGRFVDSNDWARAWQARGGVMVTARRPE
jgi:hypothetical protein